MIKYILSEAKKSIGKKYTRVYAIGILVLILVANIAVLAFRTIYGANEGTYAYNVIEYATWCFIIPYYSCIFISDIVFGKDYPNPLIKDGLTSSLSRVQIYLSKFFASIIVGALFMVIAIVALFTVTCLFHVSDGMMKWYDVTDFLGKLAIAVPLWLAGLSFGNMFLFMFDRKKYSYIGFFVLTLILPRIVMIFAAEPFKIGFFRLLRTYTITQNMSLIPYLADPARNVVLTVVLGFVYMIVAIVVGCCAYSRKKFD